LLTSGYVATPIALEARERHAAVQLAAAMREVFFSRGNKAGEVHYLGIYRSELSRSLFSSITFHPLISSGLAECYELLT